MKIHHLVNALASVRWLVGGLTCCTVAADLWAAEPANPPPIADPPAAAVVGEAVGAGSLHPFFWPESVLTAEQRKQYRAAISASSGRLSELDQQLRAAQQELDEAVLAEPMDENLIREKVAAIARIEGEKTILRARALAAVRSSLTAEQLSLLKNRDVGPRPKATPEEMEAKRREIQASLEKRLEAEHDARRQQLGARLESEIAELRKKQDAGPLTAEETNRLERLERMKKRLETGRE